MITVQNVSKSFDGRQVLRDITVSFPEGKATAVMGPSGCGKTTLLSILMGLFPADSGTVTGVPEKKAAVFQEDRLCEDFTAFENVRLVLPAENAADRAAGKARILDTFDSLLLGASAFQPVRELSGGQKRRVAIARAALSDADILFLDEPFKGLDEASKKEAAKLLSKTGKTMILVTHDRAEADLLEAEVLPLTFPA